MIKAAFFDLDGTLLSHRTKGVPQSTLLALEKLRSAGVLCVLATGRQIQEIGKLPVSDLRFDSCITLNGQLILDDCGQVVYDVPITGKAREYLLKLFSEHTIPILMVQKENAYLNFVDSRVEFVQRAISSAIPPLGEYREGEIYQACAYLGPGDEAVLAPIQGECVMTRWAVGGLDIIAKGGGKVSGIRRYLQETGIRPEETIAFGDGENDIGMLSFAGIGVAMGNAEPEVKAAADYVTADIDDDGIYKALQHLQLL